MSGGKTEEPTPRRLRRALEEGDSGASAFAAQAVALIAAIALTPAAIAAAAARVEERLRQAIELAASPEPSARLDVARAAGDVVALSLPILAGVAVAAAATTIVQTGGFLGGRRLAQPRLDRLDLLGGIRRELVSRVRLFAVTRALAGGAIVAGLVAHELRAHAGDLARTAGRLAYAGPAAAAIARTIAWDAAAAGMALAVVDVVVMRFDRLRRLRMSKDEVVRERRESEGDPVVKEERARAGEDLRAHGTAFDVKGAAVVVWDGGSWTCALRWSPEGGDRAPVVVASGEGGLGEAIVRAARAYGVALVERPAVLPGLRTVEAGREIPEAMYDEVAEILREASEG